MKDKKFRYLIPILRKLAWLMARSKARIYDFLFAIIELISVALTVEALQGKKCQDSLLSRGVAQF